MEGQLLIAKEEFKVKLWHLALFLVLNFGAMYFFNAHLGDRLDNKIMESISQNDSLKGRSQVIREIYNNNKTNNIGKTIEIVHKYDTLPRNLDSVNCNAKLKECAKDVNIQANMLKECYSNCDTLMISKDKVITSLDQTIELLKNKKTSPFGVFGGVGVGINQKGEINPTALIGVGFKIK